jgi:hypothetical protein
MSSSSGTHLHGRLGRYKKATLRQSGQRKRTETHPNHLFGVVLWKVHLNVFRDVFDDWEQPRWDVPSEVGNHPRGVLAELFARLHPPFCGRQVQVHLDPAQQKSEQKSVHAKEDATA